MDAIIEVETIAPWYTPPGMPVPRIARRENGQICCQGYVEGGEDGTPALKLPAKARPGAWMVTLVMSGKVFTQKVLIEADGVTVRLWRPIPV